MLENVEVVILVVYVGSPVVAVEVIDFLPMKSLLADRFIFWW